MSRFLRCSLITCSLLILLAACQSTVSHDDASAGVDSFAASEQVLDRYLAAKQLELAGQQFAELSSHHPDEPRLAGVQQRLANAWLERGEQALQEADLTTASAALMQAKRLLPDAPALTEGLSAALAAVQPPALEPVAKPPAPVKRPAVRQPSAAKKAAAVTEPTAKPKPNPAETEAVEPSETSAIEPAVEATPVKRSKVKARIIDANAEQTVIAMPMLNARNAYQLGRLLDDVAVDVVGFRAAVAIEVADTRDFHWVAALLSARVKKLDANFKPRLQEVIRSEAPAQLVITPNKSL